MPSSDIGRAWEGLLGASGEELGGSLTVQEQVVGPPHSMGLSTLLNKYMSTLQQVLANPKSANIVTN